MSFLLPPPQKKALERLEHEATTRFFLAVVADWFIKIE